MGGGESPGLAWTVAALGPALLLLLLPGCSAEPKRYKPTWESLDTRELPAWFDEAKFGIFIHWGVYTVPGFGSEWFWWYWRKLKLPEFVDFMKANYPPGFTYEDFAVEFKGAFFNASTWAYILESSGAKYVVLTTKHHEGFNLWKSKNSWNWNSVDRGPRRDIVKDMEVAIRNKTKMYFGLYYSLFEWFNPLFLEDQANFFLTRHYPTSKSLPDLYELVSTYKPDILWSDGDGDVPDIYWNSTGFLAWLYNDSPVRDTVVTNDRWGLNTICKHGGFFTCADRYNPGHLLPHKWENCLTIDKKSWSYRRNAELSDYLTIEEIVEQLMETISYGGNFLINIGPTRDGVIPPIFEERLRQVGSWMQVNGESIYGTKPWRAQNDTVTPRVWYTSKPKEKLVYAMFLQWPSSRLMVLGQPTATDGATEVKLLGYEHPLKWTSLPNHGIVVKLPELILEELPCKWGWSLEMKNVN